MVQSWAYDHDVIADTELRCAPDWNLLRHVERASNYDADEPLTSGKSCSVAQ
jgi:hypothetical protein